MRILFTAVGLATLFTGCGDDEPTNQDGTPVVDADQDGHAEGHDCDDSNADVFPGAQEQCNGIDDNCDGSTDEGLLQNFFPDTDGDGFGDLDATATAACEAPTDFVEDHTDCDDADDAVFPGATEVCNSVDDDCDGTPDSGLTFVDAYPDADKDLYGDANAKPVSVCLVPAGFVEDHSDCNDADGSVSPAATEVCNDVDDNCDGTPDSGLVFADYYPDVDLDGYGDPAGAVVRACEAPAATATNTLDCDDGSDAVHPDATETCNLVDDDCDGSVDEALGTPRENLAAGATVSASSTFSGYSASNVVDGSRSTAVGGSSSWTNGGGAGPHSLEIDLGSNQTFSRIDLYTSEGLEAKVFRVDVWNGGGWEVVADVTNNTEAHRVMTFDEVTGSKVRFVDLVGPDSQSVYARINEVEIYTNQAVDATVSASSTYGTYSAEKTNDGSRSTAVGESYGWTNNGSGSLPAELTFDFEECRSFDHIELFSSTSYEIRDYDVEYYDGAQWVLIDEVRANGHVQVTHPFDEVAGERVRIRALYGSSVQSAYARVNEVEIY